MAQISRATDESMQSGISFLSVLRVMTIGANRAVQIKPPTTEEEETEVKSLPWWKSILYIIGGLAALGNIRASFEGGRYTDRQFRGRSAECNDGKSDIP